MSETTNISGASDVVRDAKFANYSNASIIRQAAIPKSVRVARARQAALARWNNTSMADRRAHALKMVEAKQTPKK